MYRMTIALLMMIFITMAVLSYHSGVSGRPRKKRIMTTCREPNLDGLDKPLLPIPHDSFSLMQPFVDSVVTLSDVPSRYVNVLIKNLDDTRNCSVLKRRARQHAGSVCPTYHVLNFDDNRRPKSLIEARCSCRNCADPNAPGELFTLLSCQPIIYHTRVLRRFGCHNETYVYRTSWEPLQVGCTCNFPQSRRSYHSKL